MVDISIIIPTTLRAQSVTILSDVLKKVHFIIDKNKIKIEVLLILDANVSDIEKSISEKLDQFINEYPFFKYYQNGKSGAASNRNYGVRVSNGRYLLFMDDDIMLPDSNVIISMYKFVIDNPHTAINPNWVLPHELINEMLKTKFGRFLINVNLVNYKGWVYLPEWRDDKIFETHKLAAFCLMISREDFIRVNGFNEVFKYQGIEDDIFSFNLSKNNIKLFINPLIYVYHYESDRMDIRSRMKRFYIGAMNRKIAYELLGFSQYKIVYHPVKKIILNFISLFPNFWYWLFDLLPNTKYLDFISFKIAHIITAINIYKGFKSKIDEQG